MLGLVAPAASRLGGCHALYSGGGVGAGDPRTEEGQLQVDTFGVEGLSAGVGGYATAQEFCRQMESWATRAPMLLTGRWTRSWSSTSSAKESCISRCCIVFSCRMAAASRGGMQGALWCVTLCSLEMEYCCSQNSRPVLPEAVSCLKPSFLASREAAVAMVPTSWVLGASVSQVFGRPSHRCHLPCASAGRGIAVGAWEAQGCSCGSRGSLCVGTDRPCVGRRVRRLYAVGAAGRWAWRALPFSRMPGGRAACLEGAPD